MEDEIWYLNFIITNQMILISFKYAGICSEFDGSEDNRFRGYEDWEKENEILVLENEEALDQEDD